MRHDVLLIVDNTGSMAPYVQQVKDAFEEIADLVKGMIDLRVDLWSLEIIQLGGRSASRCSTGSTDETDTFQESMNQWMQAG